MVIVLLLRSVEKSHSLQDLLKCRYDVFSDPRLALVCYLSRIYQLKSNFLASTGGRERVEISGKLLNLAYSLHISGSKTDTKKR